MKKILIIVADSASFLSHRLSIACALRDHGFNVYVATTLSDVGHKSILRSERLEFVDLKKRSKGFDVYSDLRFFFCLISIMRRIKPDFILSVTIRVVFISLLSLMFSFMRGPRFFGMITGLGFLGVTTKLLYKLIKVLVLFSIKCMCMSKKVNLIVQNPDDYKVVSNLINKCRLFLILGSGVDVKEYFPLERNSSEFIKVTMVSRMLKDKGVVELVEASRIISSKSNIKIMIRLVGDVHLCNPASCKREELKNWDDEGIVSWFGPRNDIVDIYHDTDIAVLPSYREGLPKSLLEAAACGLPVITTDTPGCREICKDGENGLLVPPRNSQALSDAILTLAYNPQMRIDMGIKSRMLVEQCFSSDIINNEMLRLFEQGDSTVSVNVGA